MHSIKITYQLLACMHANSQIHHETMNTTLKHLEMAQVYNTKTHYEYSKEEREMYLIFYHPFRSGIPTTHQLELYTKQHLEDDDDIDQTYMFHSVGDIKEVFRYDDRFDFPCQISLADIVDNSYYQFKISIRIKQF